MSERARLLAILGLAPTASLADAKAAYRQKARTLHPDKPGGSAKAMAAVNAAWDRVQVLFANPSLDGMPSSGTRPSQRPNNDNRPFKVSLRTKAATQALHEETITILGAFLDQRIAVLQQASRWERWLGNHPSFDLEQRIHVVHATDAARAEDGSWRYFLQHKLVEGENIVLIPTMKVVNTKFAIVDGPVHRLRVVHKKGDPDHFTHRFKRLGTLHFACYPSKTKRMLFTTHPDYLRKISTIDQHDIGEKALLIRKMLDGTAPMWSRPLLQAFLDARTALGRAWERLGRTTGASS